MSEKERDILVVLDRVARREMTLVEAASVLSISYRQCGRRMKRYRERGAEGLKHGLRGKRSNRSIGEETRERVVGLYMEKYVGFGPVLFAEKLEENEAIRIDHETVRRVLIGAGLWRVTRERKPKHRAWRDRREHFGEMVQMDGSHHRWFGDDGKKSCLMVMIDDATGRRISQFSEEETTAAAMRLLWKWILRFGVPRALYTDRKNVYVPSQKAVEKGRLEGRDRLTQFGRACRRLGVRIIRAHSPQAKGRVERANEVYQDRLVKELRLRGIKDLAGANELLAEGFDDNLNRKFAIAPKEAADYHFPPPETDLASVFCIEEERKLSANWTLSFEGIGYEIDHSPTNYSPRGGKVLVRQYLDATMHMYYRGWEVGFRRAKPAEKVTKIKRGAAPRKPKPPAADHPWRQRETGFSNRARQYGSDRRTRPSV